ncbi:MAG: flavin prenyltransferase UbiX [Planctomycetaceae bacterium]
MSADDAGIVLAVTGASGSAYALRLAQVLLSAGHRVELLFSDAARLVISRELGLPAPGDRDSFDIWRSFLETSLHSGLAADWGFSTLSGLSDISGSAIRVNSPNDFSAGIASGSFLTKGMIVCPCSMGTLSSIACGASTNLIQRAADVHLKERRPLVLVPRETPLGLVALRNMTTLTQAGATILPAMPGFYHEPRSLADVVDFIVARICDHLHVKHDLVKRWGADAE